MTEFESILTSFSKEKMINYFTAHIEVIDEAISLAISDKQPFSWRSAWLIGSSIKINDKRLINRVDEIILSITNKKDGHQRELLKILEKLDLNSEQEGKLLNICLNIWETINKTPSIRYTAFKTILRIAKNYPELANEIDYLLNNQYTSTLSSGIKHSLNRLVDKFRKEMKLE